MRDRSIDRGYRSIPEGRRHDSREWKRGWGNHKEDAPARRQWEPHCDSRDIKTKDHDGWGEVTNEEVASADIKTKDHDGWGEVTTGGVALADGASGWENVPIGDRSNWNKPPDNESVKYWDDFAVRETWELLQRRQTPKPDWDLYIETHINWNSRIPRDLLESVDDKRRSRTVCVPQSRSPVILGLETLIDAQVLDTGSKKLSGSNHQHGKGGSSGWGDLSQKTFPAGQGTQPQIVSGEKRKTWDSFKEKGFQNRSENQLERSKIWQQGLPLISKQELTRSSTSADTLSLLHQLKRQVCSSAVHNRTLAGARIGLPPHGNIATTYREGCTTWKIQIFCRTQVLICNSMEKRSQLLTSADGIFS